MASAALFAPQFLLNALPISLQRSRAGKVLVVIQLSGGNDGLNTVVPYRNDVYYQLRPTLALPKNEVLPVGDELGFHPALAPLRGLYDNGQMSVINGVGYPNPDRSHFRSMDIWHTASGSDEYLSTGWIGRYLDSECAGCASPHWAVEADDSLSLAMKGAHRGGFAMRDAKQLQRTTQNRFLEAVGSQGEHYHPEENVAYLYKTMVTTQQTAGYLVSQTKAHRSAVSYPATGLGRSLEQIARLLTADTDTRVYYASMGGFDTHAQQQGRQERLLGQYAEAVKAFTDDLRANALLDDVLILTFSEFGRRVQQNGSGGTDHGTANNVFAIGGQLKTPGFYNPGPNLMNLDEGDLKYEIDFRRIYASVLDRWLEADSRIVLGEAFTGVEIV
jgi:uncharacterized protein (DUF1501 family)